MSTARKASRSQDRVDRFAALKDAFRVSTGKVLTSCIVIGIASDGEAFYGATCQDPADVPKLRSAIKRAEKFCFEREAA